MAQAYYAETAYDSNRIQSLELPDNNRFSFTTRQLRRNPLARFSATQCGEFLSMDDIEIIELLNSEDKESLKDIASPGHECQPWYTLNNPKVLIDTLTGAMAFFAVISWAFVLMMSLYFILAVPKFVFSSSYFGFLLIPTIVLSLYLTGRFLSKRQIFQDKYSTILNRRKGTILCPSKKNPDLEIPFEEFDPYVNRSTDTSARIGYHLCLCHRYSEEWVSCPDEQDDLWGVFQLWEFWQQYMDISKPLPDVPKMEPFRSRDPVTATYDKKFNRPVDYWKHLDLQKADAMQDAAIKAASQYPWGLTREQALAQGWQPSGMGEGDWRGHHEDADQPLQAKGTI